MRDEYYDTYYDEKHGEDRVVVDGQLYRVKHTKVGAPESNRFTASGPGSISWTPIDEEGNPVPVRRWLLDRLIEAHRDRADAEAADRVMADEDDEIVLFERTTERSARRYARRYT